MRIAGITLLAVLVIIVRVLFINIQDTSLITSQTSTTQQVTEESTPLPTQPLVEENTPLPTAWIITPTPEDTPPPVPTPLPTPITTRIPIARFPLAGIPPEAPDSSYNVFHHDNNNIIRYTSAENKEEVVLDVYAQTSLFLGRRGTGTTRWGELSPSGEQMALVLTNFESLSDFHKEGTPNYKKPEYFLYLFNFSTRELKLIVENAVYPVWSPDGTRIAFRDRQTGGLNAFDVATGQIESLWAMEPDLGHQADWYVWSPDSQRIAVVKAWNDYANAGGIWIVDTERRDEAYQLVGMEFNAMNLSWSPSGKQLLFLSGEGRRDTPERPINLWVINLEGGNYQQVTFNFTLGGRPTWSPDEKYIAFTGTNLLEQENIQYDVWLLDSASYELYRLTDDLATEQNPVWSVGGGKLLFDIDNTSIWSLNLMDRATQQLIPNYISYWFMQ